jgi:hypothetical protein
MNDEVLHYRPPRAGGNAWCGNPCWWGTRHRFIREGEHVTCEGCITAILDYALMGDLRGEQLARALPPARRPRATPLIALLGLGFALCLGSS